MSSTKGKKRSPWTWIPTLYMAEGFPYVIVMSVATVMYERLGLTTGQIALYTSWLYLPWVIKPFWSPIVDLFRTKRWWIVSMQLTIGASLASLAFTLQTSAFVQWSLAAFWLMAFSSATHDIAADGFYMLALNPREQAFFVGIRSTFYRVASILGQGLLIVFAGAFETFFKPSLAWSFTFMPVALLFFLFFAFHAHFLPRPVTDRCAKQVDLIGIAKDFGRTFLNFFLKKQILAAILFMLLFRLPEALLVKISPLFLLKSPDIGGLGLSTSDIGIVQGTLGVIGLTLGGILGGMAAEHGGLKRWIWPMVLAITLPDAVYIPLAYFQPEGLGWVSLCVFIEQFGYGFGFTAYMLYLIYFSKGETPTAHYAFCTGFMALGMMLPGMVAGYIQEFTGFLNFFILTTCFCVLTFIVSALISVEDEPNTPDETYEPMKAGNL